MILAIVLSLALQVQLPAWEQAARGELEGHAEGACDSNMTCERELRPKVEEAIAALRTVRFHVGEEAVEIVLGSCRERNQAPGSDAVVSRPFIDCVIATARQPREQILALQPRSQPATASGLMPFEFKGLRPGQPVNGSSMPIADCQPRDEVGRQMCNISEGQTVGGVPIFSGQVWAAHGRFYQMALGFRRDEYPLVFAALRDRYGRPCRSEARVAHNGYGEAIDNPTVIWCFAEGELELSEVGVATDYSVLIFSAPTFTPPGPRPPRDF